MSELARAEASAFTVVESIAKYYLSRAKLITKALKYPNIEDYKMCLTDLDEKEYINLKLCCLDLANNFAILQDLVWKNMEKITKPRPTAAHHHMY